MTLTEKITERIYKIRVRLPNNPLKYLNSYVIFGDRRNLVIDTGFDLPESWDDFSGGISELSLDMNNTDIFLTHCHADHTGLAAKASTNNTRIYVSAPDRYRIDLFIVNRDEAIAQIIQKQIRAGFPKEEIAVSIESNPALKNIAKENFETIQVREGHIFDLGGISIETLSTIGHSPGHMCLYIQAEKILFTGDCVLFNITPNITDWSPDLEDALGAYFDSLNRLKTIDVALALPAHRETGNFYERIDELLAHHEQRLAEVQEIIMTQNGLTAFEIASRMSWRISHNDWDSFPTSQKSFAVGEAVAHLKYLELRGHILSIDTDGVTRYFST